jgi:hypothetical protein
MCVVQPDGSIAPPGYFSPPSQQRLPTVGDGAGRRRDDVLRCVRACDQYRQYPVCPPRLDPRHHPSRVRLPGRRAGWGPPHRRVSGVVECRTVSAVDSRILLKLERINKFRTAVHIVSVRLRPATRSIPRPGTRSSRCAPWRAASRRPHSCRAGSSRRGAPSRLAGTRAARPWPGMSSRSA